MRLVLIAWLIVGAVAAIQRGWLDTQSVTCHTAASTLLTVAVGPLNYVGVNPSVECRLPSPSR